MWQLLVSEINVISICSRLAKARNNISAPFWRLLFAFVCFKYIRMLLRNIFVKGIETRLGILQCLPIMSCHKLDEYGVRLYLSCVQPASDVYARNSGTPFVDALLHRPAGYQIISQNVC